MGTTSHRFEVAQGPYFILANRDPAKGFIYVLGESARGVWEAVIESEWMGTGVSKEMLKKQGWYAKKIGVSPWR